MYLLHSRERPGTRPLSRSVFTGLGLHGSKFPAPLCSSSHSLFTGRWDDVMASFYVSFHKLGSFWIRKPRLKKKHPHQISLWPILWCIFLTDDLCGRDQLTVGGATTGQVGLGV